MWVYVLKTLKVQTHLRYKQCDYLLLSHSARLPGCTKLAGMRIRIYAKIELVFCEKYKTKICALTSRHMRSSKLRPIIGPEKLRSKKSIFFGKY